LKNFFTLDDFHVLIFLVPFEKLTFIIACLDWGIMVDVFYAPTF
jgi:hypothetical protein